jgi:choline dehydrogenase
VVSCERHVVLSAGAYGSPAILLRSGIGPERGLPVGEGLNDHVGVGLGFAATERLQRETAAFEREHPVFMGQVTVALRSAGCPPDLRDLFLFPGVDPAPSGGYEGSAAAFAMKPGSRGSVRLTSRDPRAPLAIDHGFLADPADAEALEEGVEVLRGLVAGEPLRAYATRELRPGPDVPARRLVREQPRGFFHPVGTCAIGGVVDGDGRVHGIEGLTVADASIMPAVPRSNTNLSTIALAERLAERMEA